MTQIKVSKNVRPGKLVFMRGGKLCVASKVKPMGVYSSEQKNTVMTLDGKTVHTTLPERVVLQGVATVQMFVPDLKVQDEK